MTKKILATIFFLGLMLGMPAKAEAAAMIEVIDTEIQNVSLSVNESVLHITGANGMVLHVYNVAGVRVMSVKVEGADKRIELNLPKGCYIVKVGKLVRKISIQ
ncbi:MAG: T9SS type A sorting domain-containing protein [Prevotella sp.]|jgi:hypothetical protein|nr:T9SS type A sorting domain-containing protein [Prevotella sp.]MBR3088577.1 T9SS type A sorting domain-containing protein [Prevotella sp.]